jgi:hypothetical protein
VDPSPAPSFTLTRRRLLGYVAPAIAGALALPRALVLGGEEPPRLVETPSDDEGPFYRPGAPDRSDLRVAGSRSPLLSLSGVVRAEDGKALPGVLLDLWHADFDGAYDLSSPAFRHRGRTRTDAGGGFRVETNLPGRYGRGLRPRHVHVKLSGEGLYPLTTQAYFLVRPDRDAPRELVVALRWSGGSRGSPRRATGVWNPVLARKA